MPDVEADDEGEKGEGGVTRISPTVAQFEFAARVRGLREARQLKAKAVSDHLGFSANYWSAIENSRALLATERLGPLLELLEVEEDEAAELTDLLAAARKPGWWQDFSSTASPEFLRFVGLEYGASRIWSYENAVFHGLLQTEEYARAMINAAPHISPVEVRRSVALRMRRQQELFGRDQLPSMTFLLSEAVLMQHYGGPRILHDQLQHVLDLANDVGESLELRVQRFERTPLGFTGAATVVILGFDRSRILPIAWREAGTHDRLDDGEDSVELLKLHLDRALGSTASHAESLEMLAERIHLLRG